MTTDNARGRLVQFGRNELHSREHRSRWQLVLSIAREPMLLLLVAATAIYVGFGDVAEATALGLSVLAIAGITLLQERRTERALDALRELASPHARVLRDGAWCEIDARLLVPGDVVLVAEGDRAPADVILREGAPLTVDESLLTGESVPVVRSPDPAASSSQRPGEPGPAVFAGTLITSGTATAEVIATGARAQVGRIGAALGEIELVRAPLHREVTRAVRRIAVVALALCGALIAIYLTTDHGPLDSILAGITLAMTLLPEELPLVLTVFLTLGAWRMTRHRVLARRAAAIETLGAVSVLCVDKTGTLTVNRMTIRRIVTDVSHEVKAGATQLPESAHEVIEYGLLACPRRTTDAMDRAIADLAAASLARTEHVHPDWQWIREYPLSPGLLAVTHVWRTSGARTMVATKGAPEAIFDLCHLPPDVAAVWRARAEAMAADGLRVLGVARGEYVGSAIPDHAHDYSFDIVGLLGFVDPLRDETADTIEICHEAGVRVVMITGDHAITAAAIGRTAGLSSTRSLTGPELDLLDDDALAARLEAVEIIARATPAHKLRIIRALRARGEVVGMTGDGVNDAPALKAADVGIAMGRGTEVAREAAGLVILDDALSAIVAAIRTGRTIYDNLRTAATYLVAVHLPIALVALLPPLFGWPILLGPVHVVLLELVIDPTCSIVFELEPPAGNIMRRPPRGRREHLFTGPGVAMAAVLGIAAAIGPFAVVAYTQLSGDPGEAVRALGFAALVAADLALVFVVRGRLHLVERNRGVRWMVPAVIAVVALIYVIPPLRDLFGFAILPLPVFAAAAFVGVAPVLLLGALRSRAQTGRDQAIACRHCG